MRGSIGRTGVDVTTRRHSVVANRLRYCQVRDDLRESESDMQAIESRLRDMGC